MPLHMDAIVKRSPNRILVILLPFTVICLQKVQRKKKKIELVQSNESFILAFQLFMLLYGFNDPKSQQADHKNRKLCQMEILNNS